MSTNYHTPITTGAVADAATVNAPLAELDAAINALAGTDLIVDDQAGSVIYANDASVPAGATAGNYSLTATQPAIIIYLAQNGTVYLHWDGAALTYKGFSPSAVGGSGGGNRAFVVDEQNFVDELYANDGQIPDILASDYGIGTSGGRVKIEYKNGYLQLEYVAATTQWRYINFEESAKPIIYDSPYDPNSIGADGEQLDPNIVGGRVYVVNRQYTPPLALGEWIFDEGSGIWLKIGDELGVPRPSWAYALPESGATEIDTNAPDIRVVFNQAMDTRTTLQALQVRDSAGNVVLGNWTVYEKTTFLFTPSFSMLGNTLHTVYVSEIATNTNGVSIENYGPITSFTTKTVVTALLCNGTRTCYSDPWAGMTDINFSQLQTWDAGNPNLTTFLANANAQTAQTIDNFGNSGIDATITVPTLTATPAFPNNAIETNNLTSPMTSNQIASFRFNSNGNGQAAQLNFAMTGAIHWVMNITVGAYQTYTVTVDGLAYLLTTAGLTSSSGSGSTSVQVVKSTLGSVSNIRIWISNSTTVLLSVQQNTAASNVYGYVEMANAVPIGYSSCNNPNQIVRLSDNSLVGSIPGGGYPIIVPCATVGL